MKNLMLLVAAVSLTACPRREDNADADAAELAADSTEATNDEAALLSSMLDGGASGALAVTADQAAAAIAARAQARYSPAGCVTVAQNNAQLTYEFTNCVGPRGLRALNGTIDVTVSIAGDSIVADATASDFHVGLSTLDLDATATYTNAGGAQSLAVVTHSTGIGGRGFELEHEGDYTVSWDATSIAIEGAWSTSRGDLARSTTVDVSRRLGECPVGSITRNTVRNVTIEITFDGTSTATWSSSRGRSGTFPVICGG